MNDNSNIMYHVVKRECQTCGKPTNNKSGFCSVKGWDSCKKVFEGEYGKQ